MKTGNECLVGCSPVIGTVGESATRLPLARLTHLATLRLVEGIETLRISH